MSIAIAKRYRQQPYGDHYTIEYRSQRDGTWQIFCTEHPYNPYGTSVLDCHLYPDGRVCVDVKYRVDSLDRAKAVAAAFMDSYSHYVRTGVAPNGARKVHV